MQGGHGYLFPLQQSLMANLPRFTNLGVAGLSRITGAPLICGRIHASAPETAQRRDCTPQLCRDSGFRCYAA